MLLRCGGTQTGVAVARLRGATMAAGTAPGVALLHLDLESHAYRWQLGMRWSGFADALLRFRSLWFRRPARSRLACGLPFVNRFKGLTFYDRLFSIYLCPADAAGAGLDALRGAGELVGSSSIDGFQRLRLGNLRFAVRTGKIKVELLLMLLL